MKITDLSKEDQALLNTEFPAELEKEAQAEIEKANELYDVGFSKIASEIADDADKKEDEEKEEKKELSEEHKKEAAARGAFIARGVIDGLMEKGASRHGDEFHYLYDAVEEKLAALADLKKIPARAYHNFKENIRKATTGEKYKNLGERMSNVSHRAPAGSKERKSLESLAKKNKLSGKERAMEGGKAVAKGGAIGALTYGAHRAMKKED